jgi:hypothetical protein
LTELTKQNKRKKTRRKTKRKKRNIKGLDLGPKREKDRGLGQLNADITETEGKDQEIDIGLTETGVIQDLALLH